jgi:hypothetical protein
MRVRWSLVLPASGLILFAALSCHSLGVNREVFKSRPSRYFWWSSIRLDSDPLSKHPMVPTTTCQDENKDCSTWDPVYIWVDPGLGGEHWWFQHFPHLLLAQQLLVVWPGWV